MNLQWPTGQAIKMDSFKKAHQFPDLAATFDPLFTSFSSYLTEFLNSSMAHIYYVEIIVALPAKTILNHFSI